MPQLSTYRDDRTSSPLHPEYPCARFMQVHRFSVQMTLQPAPGFGQELVPKPLCDAHDHDDHRYDLKPSQPHQDDEDPFDSHRARRSDKPDRYAAVGKRGNALEEHLVEAERGDVQVQAENGRNKYRKDLQRDHQHILRYLHLRHLRESIQPSYLNGTITRLAHKEPPEPPLYPLVRKRHPVDLDPPAMLPIAPPMNTRSEITASGIAAHT